MIDCNITKNYIHERKRMCESYSCFECPLSSKKNGTRKTCRVFENCYPDKVIEIVQKWSDEHQQKTYLIDFLDKHPNAPLTNGIPSMLCPYYLGYMTKKEFKECSAHCRKCWNTPVVEESEVKK